MKDILKKPYIPYILPFAVFLILTGIGNYLPQGKYAIYPLKTVIVALLLVYFRKEYKEIKLGFSVSAILVGMVVFVIWVLPEGMYPKLGESSFNPFLFENQFLVLTLIFFRLFGSGIVVPIFEELFWRSFLIRFIIDNDFKKVPLGQFSWSSFIITTLLFGAEHNRWLVGIIAGIIYNGFLYYKKDLFPCILAHGITNLVLGIYVLYTNQWGFW